jgi:hypothetical protein
VAPKSAAICGRSESVTRTCAWLAKPAIASRMIDRVGVLRVSGGVRVVTIWWRALTGRNVGILSARDPRPKRFFIIAVGTRITLA